MLSRGSTASAILTGSFAAVVGLFICGGAEAGPATKNLTVQLVTPSELNPAVGQTISIVARIRNLGGEAIGEFDIDLFYNPVSPPVVGQTGDQTVTVPSLGASSSVDVVFTDVTSAVEATWETYVVADARDAVAESSEIDNVSLATAIAWGAPDLIITEIVPSNSGPAAGDTISVTVTVKNQGTADGQGFSVDLFENPVSAPALGLTGDRTQTVLTLAPNLSTNVTFAGITSADPVTWGMYAIVNTDSAVIESDDANNVGGPSQVVWGEAGAAPDLTITGLAPSDAAPPAGSTISVSVTVGNLGDASGSFRVDLFYNPGGEPGAGDAGDQYTTVAGLDAGASTVVTFVGISSAVHSDWAVYAFVDSMEGVAESDEENNVAGPQAVLWSGVDLVVTAVAPSESSALLDGMIDIEVTVRNLGNVEAVGPFPVALFYDRDPAPGLGDVADMSIDVASLGADASTIVTFLDVTSTYVGTWSMYAIVDNAPPASDVDEYDETNNISGPVAVTWEAPDLVVLSMTPSNSSPTVNDVITVNVVIQNVGDADAGPFEVGLFDSELAEPSPGEAADHVMSVTDLGAGKKVTLTFDDNITAGAAATWYMYAVADNVSAGGVVEGDEMNNVGGPVEIIWAEIGKSPDLVVVSVVPTKTDPLIEEAISVDVTVRNEGSADAGGFNVALFFNEDPAPSVGGAADRLADVASLTYVAPGNEATVTFTDVTSAAPGQWTMYAIVDNGKSVAEEAPDGDEGNNVSSGVSLDWLAPQLLVTSVVPSDANPIVGDTIWVDVTVENIGDAPAGTFDVDLYFNESPAPDVGDAADLSDTAASLAVDGQATLTFTAITSSSGGDWNMYAAVDGGSSVAESDESDNVAGPVTVTWHGPDLAVAAITPSDATPTTMDTITIDVTIRNLGDRNAAAFVVGLFLNRATAPSVGFGADVTQTVTSLAAGDLTTVSFTGVANTDEEVWKTWVIADNGSAVIEGDETNNIGGPATVTWGTPAVADLVVVSIQPSNPAPNVDDTITVDVVVANNGSADASLFDVGLYYNLAGVPTVSTLADQVKHVGSIPAGTQKTLTFDGVTSGLSEVWRMYAFIDCTDVVVEPNESNNTRGPVEVNWGSITEIVVLVPNGGEEWESGTVQQVRWESHGDIGTTNVTIDFSVDGGITWAPVVDLTADDGVYDWDVPLDDSTLCLVRVVSEGGSYSDVSDGAFTIAPPGVGKPNLRIVSISPSSALPNAGDTIAVDVTVRNAGNAVSGMFYVDLFYNRSTAPAVGAAGDQSKPVTILAAGEETNVVFTDVSSASIGIWHMYAIVDTQGYVEESNEGDNVAGPTEVGWGTMVASFKITAPNGWEVLERTRLYPVTWTWTGDPGTLVQIEVSTDGGVIWEVVDGTLNDGAYDWTLSGGLTPSTDCRLRVSNFLGSVTDVSDDVFVVANAPPTASISAHPAAGTRPLPLSFDGSASADPEGAIASWEWDFDYDGVPANFSTDATGPTAQHTYDEAGVFTAALRVMDGDGATDITTTGIPVDSLLYFGYGCRTHAVADGGHGLAASTLLLSLAVLVCLGRGGGPAHAGVWGKARAHAHEGVQKR